MKPKRTTRFLRILVFSLPVLAGTADLWASGGEKGDFSSAVIWQSIAFVLLIVLLSRFVKKPLSSFLLSRQEEVQNAIKQSARKKEEAEALLGQLVEDRVFVPERPVAHRPRRSLGLQPAP